MESNPNVESSFIRDKKLRWPIGAKLTIIFIALVIVPMSLTAYYNLTHTKNEVDKVAKENLVERSHGTSRHIEQVLVENQRASATLAGEPLVIEFLTASEEERYNLTPQVNQTLKNFADTHPDYDAPGILDVNGIVVASLEPVLVGKNRSFRDYFQASIQGEPSRIFSSDAPRGDRASFSPTPWLRQSGRL